MRNRFPFLFYHTVFNKLTDISRSMGRRKRQKQKNNPLPYKNERNYSQTVKENELFRKFYSGLGIMPESEVQEFYDQMKEPLPITFRITGYKSEARELHRLICNNNFQKLIGSSSAVADIGDASNTGTLSAVADAGGAISTSSSSAVAEAGDAISTNVSEMDCITDSATSSTEPSSSKAEDVADSTSQQVADGASQQVADGASQQVADGASQQVADGTSQQVADGTSQQVADGTSQQVAEESKSVGTLAGKSDAAPDRSHKDAIRPKCITWYPDQLAWQIDASRKDVRSQEVMSKLHEFLVTETDCGNISRQEAVSMIPPLVLDVQSDSKVLDMCAAPGSKTVQLIEYLHKDGKTLPEGFVVANDKENSRCYLMVHQVKRLSSPCYMIVNHDASIFPKLEGSDSNGESKPILFDRILADVPCSGDGTMRKNIDVWKKWNPTMGNSLHRLQLKILKRGLELLEVGGRLVYSTCSMQPVEDEAVIAEALRICGGSVKLVDVSSKVPNLKSVPGLSHWTLMNQQGQWLKDFDNIPDHFKKYYSKSMFSPTTEEAATFNLNLCHRILPHHQNTGGFFVAALEKTDHLPWSREARLEREKLVSSEAVPENKDSIADAVIGDTRKRKAQSEDGPQAKRQEMKGYKEDPFLFLEPQDPVYDPIKKFYGLPDDFPVEQLLYRSETGAKRALYFVSKAIQQIVSSNAGKIRFINMGVKCVSRSPSPVVPDCDFRIAHECVESLRDAFATRTVTITKEDAIVIFKEENPFTQKMCQATQDALENISPGSLVFAYKPTEGNTEPACDMYFCGWKGKYSVRSFVPRHVRSHCLRLLGQDLAKIQAEVARMKAERQATKAANEGNVLDTD